MDADNLPVRRRFAGMPPGSGPFKLRCQSPWHLHPTFPGSLLAARPRALRELTWAFEPDSRAPPIPVLRRPNAIDAADLRGCVYGALLYNQYGRGDCVCCSLALYRQLRVGHAGAAWLLINSLAR